MENAGWQTIGTTVHQDFPYVTHIGPETVKQQRPRPKKSLKFKRSSSLGRKQSVAGSSKSPGPAEPGLRRQNAVRLSPLQKLRRFFRRFTWSKRSKTYRFGKKYLRRHSSYVVTPDQSSYNFRFKNRDLASKQPRPDSWRSARPVQAWKSKDPMQMLASNNINVGTRSTSAQPNVHHLPTPGEPGTTHSQSPSNPNNSLNRDDTRQSWIKVSLPVRKPAVNTFTGTGEESSGNSQRSDPAHGPEGVYPQTPELLSSHAGPMAMIAPTPQTRISRSSSGEDNDKNLNRSNITPPGPQTVPLDATPSLPHALAGESHDSAEAITAQGRDGSPTSARAQFRPASWRSSLVLPRQLSVTRRSGSRRSRRSRPSQRSHARQNQSVDSAIANSELDMVVDDAMEFVGAWSAYLRRAVALRAVLRKERTSWEMSKEEKWATSPYYDTSEMSSSSLYSGESISGESDNNYIEDSWFHHSRADSDSTSALSIPEADLDSEDDSGPERDPEDLDVELLATPLSTKRNSSRSERLSSDLDSMRKRYSNLLSDNSNSDPHTNYRTASETSFPAVASTWKPEANIDIPEGSADEAPVTALHVRKGSTPLISTPGRSERMIENPAILLSSDFMGTPIGVSPQSFTKESPPGPIPPRNPARGHRPMESLDFGLQEQKPRPSRSWYEIQANRSSPKLATAMTKSDTESVEEEAGGALLQDYYRERRENSTKKTAPATEEEEEEQRESLIIRQNTLRSQWGATTQQDSD